MSDSVRSHRRQPNRLPRPWDSPGKNTGVGCHFLLQCRKVKSESEVAQSCLTLSNPMDCSLPGSSIHGIFQARVLEWVAMPSSRGPSDPGIKPQSPALAGRFFTTSATWEALKIKYLLVNNSPKGRSKRQKDSRWICKLCVNRRYNVVEIRRRDVLTLERWGQGKLCGEKRNYA